MHAESHSHEFWDSRFSMDPQEEIKKLKAEGERDPILMSALNFFGDVKGKKIVDLGCGMGKSTLFFAARGASVIAVDTSRVAVQNLKRYCDENNMTNVTTVEMSVWDIRNFAPVDFVYGSMILHHLEPFDSFCDILRATIRTPGKAFFFENSSANPFLMWFRQNVVGKWGVPKWGDKEEFPLTKDEIKLLKKRFRVKVWIPELYFFRLIPIYVFRDHFFAPFKFLDSLFYQIPFFRRFSYFQCLNVETVDARSSGA